jgi:UDP-2,4-diacetamido-2,4,6-trideoxy-beta-L-altropyranose hydrolase
MAKLMASCDAAIGAGGTTQWERACIGIPSLVVSIANNQIKACEDLSSEGYIYYINSNNLIYSIDDFIKNIALRRELYIKNKQLKFKYLNDIL